MPARSVIEQLPPELRDWLEAELIRRNFAHYDELLSAFNEKLSELGLRIGRSALHEHGQKVEARLQRLRDTSQLARLIVTQIGNDEGAMNDALIRLVQDHLFGIVANMEEPDPKLVAKIGHVVADLGRAAVIQDKYRDAVREKTKEAASKVEKKARAAGLSQETIDDIKRDVLGIAA